MRRSLFRHSRRLSLRSLPAAILAAGVLCFYGCASDECLDNKSSLPLAGFYSSELKPKAIALDSLRIYAIGAPGDSVLHDNTRSLSSTWLPLRISRPTDTVRYVFEYLQQNLAAHHIADTVALRYSLRPVFVSAACGAMYFFSINSISSTRFLIDSVTCPQGMITNSPVENIKIYFRVTTE